MKEEQGQIEPGESQSWENTRIVIPSCPPSQLRFCSLIDVEYYFEVGVATFVISKDWNEKTIILYIESTTS